MLAEGRGNEAAVPVFIALKPEDVRKAVNVDASLFNFPSRIYQGLGSACCEAT
jgi:hypothetical protein